MKHPAAPFLAFAITTAAAFPSSAEEDRNWLFVMTGDDMHATDGSLVLHEEDATVFGFTDRPYRDHANVGLEHFVSFWGEGETFAEDPPNAVLTYSADGKEHEVELLLTAARLVSDRVEFSVTVEAGELPSGSGIYSLFIDSFAKPFDSSF